MEIDQDQSLSEIVSVTTEITKDIDKNIKGKEVKGVEEVEEIEEIEEIEGEVVEGEEEDTCYIHDNQYVLILLPSGNIKVVKLQKDKKISLGKFGVFHTNDIIGKPFGHSYEIHDRDKIKIIRNVAFREVDETDANNKETIDDPSKQKLSYEDIEQLKKDGLEGQDIIKKVVESHSTFNKKTEYSKAKYIKRKEAKFSRVFTPVRPTLYSVWEYFHTKNPSKIREMRIDSLSQMLTLANVRAYSKMLVIDDTQGLLISGVLERLGGYGVVIGIHDGENHNFDIMRYMNFSKKIYNSLRILSWQQVFKEESQAPFNYQNESKLSEKELKFYHRKKANYERIDSTRELLFKGGFDGLLIASQYQPESILETFIPYLRGSRPIVIYHINKEVLMNTCVHMRISRIYLNPTITESWLRGYQVLPGRTHPSMSTSGGGGYLLKATYIIIDDNNNNNSSSSLSSTNINIIDNEKNMEIDNNNIIKDDNVNNNVVDDNNVDDNVDDNIDDKVDLEKISSKRAKLNKED
ncbi:hypothetical protein Glove_360g58 [Diversispora epigaea]|uniref:tRNA (adenine(58)-N(1))-methyltransferase non-catalytic subunit TRM6 n=1 Tax=Diversispora epigaea TaxID=1348612 RepID=A0A397HA10_9GLOM|nr:hypothetical protein Glove_360g58 [Diversispora epigaea]